MRQIKIYGTKETKICPVCNGKGQVREGFYETVDSQHWRDRLARTGDWFETCRSCGGKGYIILC